MWNYTQDIRDLKTCWKYLQIIVGVLSIGMACVALTIAFNASTNCDEQLIVWLKVRGLLSIGSIILYFLVYLTTPTEFSKFYLDLGYIILSCVWDLTWSIYGTVVLLKAQSDGNTDQTVVTFSLVHIIFSFLTIIGRAFCAPCMCCISVAD